MSLGHAPAYARGKRTWAAEATQGFHSARKDRPTARFVGHLCSCSRCQRFAGQRIAAEFVHKLPLPILDVGQSVRTSTLGPRVFPPPAWALCPPAIQVPSLPPAIERVASMSAADRQRKLLPTTKQARRMANLATAPGSSPHALVNMGRAFRQLRRFDRTFLDTTAGTHRCMDDLRPQLPCGRPPQKHRQDPRPELLETSTNAKHAGAHLSLDGPECIPCHVDPMSRWATRDDAQQGSEEFQTRLRLQLVATQSNCTSGEVTPQTCFCCADILGWPRRGSACNTGSKPADTTERTDKTSSKLRKSPTTNASRRRAGVPGCGLPVGYPRNGLKPIACWPTRAPGLRQGCVPPKPRRLLIPCPPPAPVPATAPRHRPTRKLQGPATHIHSHAECNPTAQGAASCLTLHLAPPKSGQP